MLNEDIICFSSIDWDFNWQGHQEIMSRLARAGNRVLFVENTGVRTPRLGDYKRMVSRIRNWRRGIKGDPEGRAEPVHLQPSAPAVPLLQDGTLVE